jgi:indole-3-glycerol phosphate synthase
MKRGERWSVRAHDEERIMSALGAVDLRVLRPGSVLSGIIARKISDVNERAKRSEPLRPRASDRSFFHALEGAPMKPALIAEIKRRSPSQGPLREDLDLGGIAAIYGRHAAAISVVTDAPFFGGSLEMLMRARTLVKQPVLLKDFVVSEYQVYEARAIGADAVLLMASVLPTSAVEHLLGLCRSLGMEALVEVHDRAELDEIIEQTTARIIGVNNRDLSTLVIDKSTFTLLAEPIRSRGLIAVAESGMETREDIEALAGKADAALIGTTFMKAIDVEAKILELGW